MILSLCESASTRPPRPARLRREYAPRCCPCDDRRSSKRRGPRRIDAWQRARRCGTRRRERRIRRGRKEDSAGFRSRNERLCGLIRTLINFWIQIFCKTGGLGVPSGCHIMSYLSSRRRNRTKHSLQYD